MVEKCKAIVESSPIANKPMFLVDLSGMMTVCKKSTDSSHYNILSALLSVGMAMETAKKLVGNRIGYAADAYEAAKDADVLAVLTEWSDFKSLDLAKLKTLMKVPKIVDLRNLLNVNEAKRLGFDYRGIGR